MLFCPVKDQLERNYLNAWLKSVVQHVEHLQLSINHSTTFIFLDVDLVGNVADNCSS